MGICGCMNPQPGGCSACNGSFTGGEASSLTCCPFCGARYQKLVGHACNCVRRNSGVINVPKPPLTEADVRRIIREELGKLRRTSE